jgi:hypothetical protein
MMKAIFDAMVSRDRTVDGVRTSLLDLGYVHAGIDDGFQACATGPATEGKRGFHNASGWPNVDTSKFPDMQALTRYADSLGISPGWYANNCHCSDHSALCEGGDVCYRGDVAATVGYGFRGLKVDGCGAQKNFSEYAPLFNETGARVLLENCHEGRPERSADGTVYCPMHLFRTSADIRPTWGAVVSNLLSVDATNAAGLTGPGCWACVHCRPPHPCTYQ